MNTTRDIASAGRIIYDHAQLEQYFDHVKLPQDCRNFDVPALNDDEQLTYLTMLQKHQLARVPFENLTLHYSWHRVINVNPRYLFKKVVGQPGRGGYCMENNSLFHTVLLSIGFKVYMTGARVYDPLAGRFGGFSHCLNIITIGGTRYAVDVGFGSYGPVVPLKLNPEEIQPHIGLATVRLRYDGISQNLWPEDRLWIYEHRLDENAPWVTQHCFTGSEFLPEDIAVMNLAPSTSPASFFTQKIVCVKFTTNSEIYHKNEQQIQYTKQAIGTNITGTLILDGNTLKWRRNGVKEWERRFENDGERVKALEVFFGIFLAEEDRNAIGGSVGEVHAFSEV